MVQSFEELNLTTPISKLGRVGAATTKKLNKLGIKTVEDLLFYFPFRYDDFSKILTVAQLKTKKSGTIKARVNLIANKRSPQKRMLITEAIVSDKTGSVKVVWFNQPFLTKILRPGQEVYLGGKMEFNEYYGLELLNPSYELVTKRAPIHLSRIVPVYPTTSRLSQKQIRYLIKISLPVVLKITDWLPRPIRTKYNLINLSTALEQIHFPTNQIWLEKASHRLKFDELFLIQLKIQLIRQKINKQKAPPITFRQYETKKFVENLPFKLTEAQRKAAWEILKDLERPQPMNRLLEGDVGSGKTVVAAIAILNVFLNNYQTAYLAPTEILAFQHFETICKLLKDWPIKIALLAHSQQSLRNNRKNLKIKKNKLLEMIRGGQVDLTIGTHALIQEKVVFKNLGLVIIDEQHRFGVEQRAKLIQNSCRSTDGTKLKIQNSPIPHFLSMTATPIPRSLALTLYGDLDLSIIDEMPKGRKNIITQIVKPDEAEKTYQFIREQIKSDRQVFVICPLIDPSDTLGVKSVKEEYKRLKEKFPDLELALLHGRLKVTEKEKIMKNFLANKINILVSTTVVEVGIDVPNASIMIIEGAERLGLAQLYQLRGRVGRSSYQSYCFLFTDHPGQKTYQRLKALLTAKNGFELAEIDLEMRGPGEILGTEQSGFLETLKIAKFSDVQIIKEAEEAAKNIINFNPQLLQLPSLQEKIKKIEELIHLD